MSHEIRTPMNAILGTAYLIRRDRTTPHQAAQLDRINSAAEHLLHIINDILDLSKIEDGILILEQTDVVVGNLLSNVASILAPRINAKGLRLVIDSEHIPAAAERVGQTAPQSLVWHKLISWVAAADQATLGSALLRPAEYPIVVTLQLLRVGGDSTLTELTLISGWGGNPQLTLALATSPAAAPACSPACASWASPWPSMNSVPAIRAWPTCATCPSMS